MATDDNQQTEAHKVILSAKSSDINKENEIIGNLEKLNNDYIKEIADLKNEIKEGIERKN